MINAFLSYRHKNDDAIKAREELKRCCEDTGEIKLVFDEDVTKEGDSLIAFMTDLVNSRCVFLFLDPDYFKSGYTLFELICIHEQEGFDNRFVHPIRLTEKMDAYESTNARIYWEENINVQERVSKLLDQHSLLGTDSKTDYDAIWVRVENAWAALIESPLDHLKFPAVEKGEVSPVLHGCVENVVPKIEEVRASQVNELHEKVKDEAIEILDNNKILHKQLARELADPKGRVQANSESIADHFLSGKQSILGLVSALIKVLTEQKKTISNNEAWEDCFYDAEQLVGWLLLLSIDPDWWFENSHNLKPRAVAGTLEELQLDRKEYIEVVVSRSLVQKAAYKVNTHGKAEPDGYSDFHMVYDSNAKEFEFLISIYKDLFKGSPEDSPTTEDLIDDILLQADLLKQSSNNKVVYYLVAPKTKLMIENFDWYKKEKNRLAGCLQFIAYKLPSDKPYEKSASKENQKALLQQVANLLKLK